MNINEKPDALQPNSQPRDTVADGPIGVAAAERVNPAFEEGYWRGQYSREPYYKQDFAYEEYDPAYRLGHDGPTQYPGKHFEDVEPDLQRSYSSKRAQSRLGWEEAKSAVRAAWHRVERALPGDADRDGR